MNYTYYGINEEEIKNEEDIEWIELGEVCEFKNGKNLTKKNLVDGLYPVIGGGKNPLGMHNAFNRDENIILCSSITGYISKYKAKVWASDCFSIHSKDKDKLNEQYLYYYLVFIQNKIYKLQNGAGQPHVYSKDLQKFIIPIPSLERQKEIVKYCEYNETLIKQLEKEIENNKKQAQQFIKSILKVQSE